MFLRPGVSFISGFGISAKLISVSTCIVLLYIYKTNIVVRQPNPDLGPYLVLRYQVFFLMDSVSLDIADDQTEN